MQFAHRLDAIETSAIRELFKLLAQPGIISFAGGFPDPSVFDTEGIEWAAQQALSAEHCATSLQYGATEGVPLLREQIAAWMGRKQMPVAASDVIVTTGCQQALDSTAKCLINPGDAVLVEAPTFLAAIQCFKVYGADLYGVPTDAQGVDVDALEEAIVVHKPKMVYLIPNFGNPAGALLSLERRKRIVQLAAQYGVTIVEDDPYGDLYFNEAPPPSLYALALEAGVQEHVVYCGSMSKVLSPGLRVGWMAADSRLLAKATMCKQFTDAHTSNLSQLIAGLYLQSGRMPQALERMRSVYAERAQALATQLRDVMGERLQFAPPAGGMFLWARMNAEAGMDAKMDAKAFAQKAVEQKVAFVPGAPFYARESDPLTLRLSYATSSLEAIEEGVQRLAKAWDA